jgi:hypothetical protein
MNPTERIKICLHTADRCLAQGYNTEAVNWLNELEYQLGGKRDMMIDLKKSGMIFLYETIVNNLRKRGVQC